MKIMGIGQEYIRKHTSEDNGDMESFYNSLKTDYIGVNDIETFDDAVTLMEYAFKDYKIVRTYSSIEYLPSEEFEKRWNVNPEFRKGFLKKREKGD